MISRVAVKSSFLSASLVMMSACGGAPPLPEDHQAAFVYGVEQQQAGRYSASAAGAWAYLKGGGEDDPRYDRALRLLARDAEALGLSYAASRWWLDIARARRDATLVPEAIDAIRRLSERGAYDEEGLINDFLAVVDLPKLGPQLEDFVSYTQGLHSLRQLKTSWAQERFAMIHVRSPYRARADYALAVFNLARGKRASAEATFKRLAQLGEVSAETERVIEGLIPDDVRRDALTSLARLSMQSGDYATGLERFERVREELPNAPELLLEIAWAHYYKGDPRRALGYLLALDAPMYSALIAPERYILEALTLRALCQFGPAREATNRLKERYQRALSDLYSGVPPERSSALRAAAGTRDTLRGASRFLEQLKAERTLLTTLSPKLGEGLTAALREVYERGVASAEAQLEGATRREANTLAQELLSADEAVRLIAHELAVALLRGRQPPIGRPPVPPLEEAGRREQGVFRFTGEFWTDELDELVVAAEDRCIDP